MNASAHIPASHVPASEPVRVIAGSGWWLNEGGYSISRSAPKASASGVAKARADVDAMAALMGWA